MNKIRNSREQLFFRTVFFLTFGNKCINSYVYLVFFESILFFGPKTVIHWGLVIRTGLSPYNQALADLITRTDKKAVVRITRSMRLK